MVVLGCIPASRVGQQPTGVVVLTAVATAVVVAAVTTVVFGVHFLPIFCCCGDVRCTGALPVCQPRQRRLTVDGEEWRRTSTARQRAGRASPACNNDDQNGCRKMPAEFRAAVGDVAPPQPPPPL